MTKNMAAIERMVSVAAGAGLLWLAARMPARARVAGLAGAGLLARGAAGYCPVNQAVGRRVRSHDTRVALAGSRGINVRESVTIRRPVEDLYRLWRNLPGLPDFMPHLERVEALDGNRTRWVARGPGGLRLAWDAEVINEETNRLIAWKSVGDGDVVTSGSVNFRPAPGGGTEVHVNLQYSPPAGKAGAWVATLLGSDPASQIRGDLRALKLRLERGEDPTAAGA